MKTRPDELEPLAGWLRAGHGGRGWWILPTPARPRLLVPVDPRGWPAAARFVATPRRRLALAAALRWCRLTRRSPDLRWDGTVPEILHRTWPGRVHDLAIYVGTASRFAKFTAAALDAAGRPLGFVKLARGKDAARAIATEADHLTTLAGLFPEETFYPRLLAAEAGLSIQSAGPPAGGGDPAATAGRLARRLFERQAEEIPWTASLTRRRLATAAEGWQPVRPDLAGRVADMLAVLDETGGSGSGREGWSHGDFVPWNLIDAPGGFAYDWEWMDRRLEFHDGFHHLWFPLLHGRRDPAAARLIRRLESPAGRAIFDAGTPRLHHALAYLASSFVFYAGHSLAGGDEPLGFPFIRRFPDLFHGVAATRGSGDRPLTGGP